MRGFEFIPSSIGLECLLFPSNWFTRTIRLKNNRSVAIAQVEVVHNGGRLLWALNISNDFKHTLSTLLDNLARDAGSRDAFYLTAAIEKNDPIWEVFSSSGYLPVSWEKIYNYYPDKSDGRDVDWEWKRVLPFHHFNILQLQNKLLSAIEKTIAVPANKHPPNYALFIKDILAGFIYINTSFDKTFITPFIDPDFYELSSVLDSMANKFFMGVKKFYVRQTPSQTWIDSALSDRIETLFPRREIVAKHLAVSKKEYVLDFNQSTSNQHTDIITPFTEADRVEDNI